MQYTGIFHVAVRGPVSVVQELPELVSQWEHSLSEDYVTLDVKECIGSMRQILLQKTSVLTKKSQKEIIVLEWESFSEIALVTLDCINAMVKAHPELEVAVVTEITLSTTDTVEHYAYYSAKGENTICPARAGENVDGLRDFLCDTAYRKSELRIPIQYQRKTGVCEKYDLMDIENIYDVPLGPQGGIDCSESDVAYTLEEGILFLLRRSEDGSLTYLEPAPDIEERFEEDKYEDELSEVFHLLTLSDSEKKPKWSGSHEELEEALQEIYPDDGIEFLVKGRGENLTIKDEEENEYLLGGQFQVGKIQMKIDWRFPPQADWIPFIKQNFESAGEEELQPSAKQRFYPTEFDGRFAGKTFVVTGEPDGYGREGTEELIQRFGGVVRSAVSGKTDYLIVGEEPGKRKLEKARELGTPILNTDEFEKMISPKG